MADRLLQEDGTSLYLQEDGLSALIIESGVTVTPNTADLTAFTTLTPTLEFTSVQADDDDVRYQVEIHNAPSTLIDSYPVINRSNFADYSTGINIFAQSFRGSNSTLGSAEFEAQKVGVPTGNMEAILYAHTGTFGSTGAIGAVLATSNPIAANNISAASGLIAFSFPIPFQLAIGTDYFIGLKYSGSTSGNTIQVGYDLTSPSHIGNGYDNIALADATIDVIFYVYTNSLVTATSGTDPGFLNTVTPADTDPFTNNQKASYTAQTSLAAGTYFWRARALDPLGTNAYGAYSTTRSFTTSAGGGATPRFRSLLGVGS